MKKIKLYNSLLEGDESVFNYFIRTLQASIKSWDYFVNWGKVFKNVDEIKLGLNTLNCLIGRRDFDDQFIQYLYSMSNSNQDIRFISQASEKKVRKEFGIEIPVDKASRIYDFVLMRGDKIYVIETNFYSGGGSKLKATANEYFKLHNHLKGFKVELIWITDGIGWHTAQKPLEETFNNNDYVLNLSILRNGGLEQILLH